MKPGRKQTEVGLIPEDWDVQSIGQMFQLINGCAFKPQDWKQTGTPIIRIQNLNDPHASFNYSQSPVAERNRVEAGDLLFAWSGTIGTSFGARIWAGPSGVLNQHIFKVLPDERKITTSFSLLVFARIEEDIAKQAHGFKASFVHVKKSDLIKVKLPIPPRREQRAIAEALSDVDALLAALDRLIAKKRDLKQAAMQQLLTGKVRLPGFHGEWKKTTLGDVSTRCFSGATPRRNRPDYFKGDIPWITSGELNYNVITDTVEKITSEAVARTNLSIVPKGIFLMAITGLEAEGTRGSCGIVGIPSTTNQSCMAIFPTSELVSEFLFHYYVFRGDALALKYCQGTKQQSYTAKLVKLLPIELPPTPAEQTAIAGVLNEMETELTSLEQRRDKTRALKQGMMQELLTGRTRLVSPESAHA